MSQENSSTHETIGDDEATYKVSEIGGVDLIWRIPYGYGSPDEFGNILSKDAKIEIPEEGIDIKINDHKVATIEAHQVDVVVDENAAIVYISLNEYGAGHLVGTIFVDEEE